MSTRTEFLCRRGVPARRSAVKVGMLLLFSSAALLFAATPHSSASAIGTHQDPPHSVPQRNFEQSDAIRRFASKGAPNAQFDLGFMYLSGEGAQKNYVEAANWFRNAADQGNRDASYFLGFMYEQGLGGLPKDPFSAAQWYRRAAFLGNYAAQVAIARMYASGIGVTRNETIAARWLFRAAQQGVPEAQIALSKMLANGAGTTKNELWAFQWAAIAAARAAPQPSPNDATQLETLTGAGLSLKERLAAAQIARRWKPEPETWASTWPLLTHEQDGVLASVSLEGDHVRVEWRSLRRPIIKFDHVTIAYDGRVVAHPKIEAYRASTSLVLMLDVSGRGRDAQIQNEKAALIKVANEATRQHSVEAVAYADSVRTLELQKNSIDALRSAVNQLAAKPGPANLGKALTTAMELPSSFPAKRQGIFIFTDGHSDDSLDVADLVKLAKDSQTSLNFVIEPDERPIAPALTQISDETGGAIVTGSDLKTFLGAPFALLDSGGSAQVPIRLHFFPMFWQSGPMITVELRNGSQDLTLHAFVPLPFAGAKQTTQYILSTHPVAIAGSSIAAAATTALALFLSARRRKTRVASTSQIQDRRSPLAFARLEDLDDGTVYPINGSVVHIGRDPENEIVLDDRTVSRFHAVLEQDATSGLFFMENRSGVNGTMVNHQPAERSCLSDGDLITMGRQTFRFSCGNTQGADAGVED